MPFCATLGVRADKYTAQEVELSLDWAPEVCTTNGILHGGVIMALADSAGGACALFNLPTDASGTLAIEPKTNFVGACRPRPRKATRPPHHVGRTAIHGRASGRHAWR